MKKIYSSQTLKGWLHWFVNEWDTHITMRLAWNPSLLLEEFRLKYWKEWDNKYLELLWMFNSIGDKWKSPFVYYFNKRKDN